MEEKRKVIIVTDGDKIARKAVERAVKQVGARCISASAGNPTPLSGEKIVNLIKKATHDPVVVMVDDRGSPQKGSGELALEFVAKHPDVDVLGVIAVASNTILADGTQVEMSITKDKQWINKAVDKEGKPALDGTNIIKGDTVDVLSDLEIPIVIGIGDIGKMEGKDSWHKGAEITTKALEYIISHGGGDLDDPNHFGI